VAVEAHTGYVGGIAAATTSCRKLTVRSHLSVATDNGCGGITLAGEENLVLAEALDRLPSGARLIIRDKSGREWCISPSRQATVTELRRAA
jgi:hypothetical protein